MMKPENVRVRFAPSPTGHLHIGGARTALFNWLFARRYNGSFILRIEDTDRERSTDEYITAIIDSMKWLGLDWDEGPFRQTDRLEVYKAFAKRLLDEGKAYRCYCTSEEIEKKRQEAISLGRTFRYDRKCISLEEKILDKPFAIRFKSRSMGSTIVNDMIKGVVEFDNAQLDDFIIVRSDGTPTYNFCVVVDDIDMKISHVIRGDDHLNNTPKQIQIYNAFGWKVPEFAQIPMILGADKTRLSKRHGATSVMAYKEMGYLPDALINYLVRLGWSYGDKEIFTIDELIQCFSLDNVGKSSSVFNPDKLLWLNGQYIMKKTEDEIAELVKPFLQAEGVNTDEIEITWLKQAITLLKERVKTLKELSASLLIYIRQDVEIGDDVKSRFIKPENTPLLNKLLELVEKIEPFNHENIGLMLKEFADTNSLKLKEVAQPIRVALTGSTASPGLFEIMELLGKEKVIYRLRKAFKGEEIGH
ncbi:MAG: glutamate--tRNA ligase [Thermodesulfovibrionales bacterium]|nr:glutamate--tRNA ligase [Thermodesulfovibrionales bacterium]